MTENSRLKKGFNNGYLLQKYYPELADKISKSFNEKDDLYQSGFKSGVTQYKKEKIKTLDLNYNIDKSTVRNKSKEKNKDLDKDK